VDAGQTTGLDDGSSWANAFQGTDGLQRSLLIAVAGDQIFVGQGTYLPTTTSSTSASFQLVDGVEMFGGFLGTESGSDERPPLGSAPSVLSGDLNGDDPVVTDNSWLVVNASGTGATTILDGFTIRGGKGGLRGDTTSLTVRGCRFVENQGAARFFGGGSSPRFVDCLFEDNVSPASGGAIAISLGAVVIDRCVFRRNVSLWGGGALYLGDTTTAWVSNSIFAENLTGSAGGSAVWVDEGGPIQFQFRNNTVVGNASTADMGRTGALFLSKSGARVVNCIFWDNEGLGGSQTSVDQITGTGASYSIVEGGLPGAGNQSAAPQFVDPSGGDYSLSLSSPAIDAGSNAAVPASILLDNLRNPRLADVTTVPDTGLGFTPIVDIGALELVPTPVPFFCDASDSALAACPCGNPGAPDTGCDIGQGTGGVSLEVITQQTAPFNRTTMAGVGFSASSFPTSIVIRAATLDAARPIVFGDGLRCVGTPVVRLAATIAFIGRADHVVGHGALAGSGEFFYQLWFRTTPSAYCTPEAFGLSNGRSLTW